MIDWLITHHRDAIRASRWIVVGSGAALLGLASLPHNPADRIIALVGLAIVAVVFAAWLGIMLVTILRPRLFGELQRKRAAAAALRAQPSDRQ